VEFNVADLFEATVDRVPDREALVCGDRRATYRALDERANRVAHCFLSLGLGRGDHIGIYAYNSIEWVETMLGAYKIRAIPINVNYRYVEEELHYLFDNADLVALVHERQFVKKIAAVKPRVPKLKYCRTFGPGDRRNCEAIGAADYEEALAASSPGRDFEPRSGDDTYLLYTGGTTGMPKGVMWRQEDVIFALGGGIDPYTKQKAERPEEITAKIKEETFLTHCPLAPLMHGAAQWTVLSQLFLGNRIVLMPGSFDPHTTWGTVEREKVNGMIITGDAVARPLVEALDEKDYDLSSFFVLSSSAAVFSPSVKLRFLELIPSLILLDAHGASEQGMTGMTQITKESLEGASKEQPVLKIAPHPDVIVLDENRKRVEPGSGVVGQLARGGNVPFGYYKDPKKSAEVFIEAEGKRWSVPGDLATVDADGTIAMLGRGSQCINSGGEKIYPEEVEAALKAHDAVFDALVVGVPDERWGQRVAAVVQLREEASLTLQALSQHTRTLVAGYKVPRELHIADQIKRSPSGKPDYPWAEKLAAEGKFKV
jgi:acyl-CoA synthetase (AMP-forming)/AMP-acid ligase II